MTCTYYDHAWLRFIRSLPIPDGHMTLRECVQYLDDVIWDSLIHQIVGGV